MRRWLRRPRRLAVLPVLAVGLLALVGTTAATYSSQTNSANDRISAAADFRAPTASAALVAKSQTPGSATGYIKQGGLYFVYATIADSGNPASGTSTVTANVSAFSTGVTAASLTAGSYTVAGVTYNYRSAVLTASNPVAEGTKSLTFSLTDVASNNATASGYSVIVDNTAPSATDVQTTNSGTAGRPTDGDKMIYTYSEPIDPDTIKLGWDGSSTSVDATVVDGASGLLGLGAGDDAFTVEPDGGGTKLPLTVGLGTDDYTYGLVVLVRTSCDTTFNSSTMAMSANTITVTLAGSSGCPRTSGAGTMTYAPTAGPTDRAGNALPTTTRNETGASDADF
jgi:Tfp pilus assembly protein PilV